ncbi:MAG: alpha/beta fold hydrolase [Alphaproteobacteria bacterium]
MRLASAEVDLAGAPVRLAYTDWGAADAARTVVCVHGLTRNGRDFDALAAALGSQDVRVLCPDMPGRGGSAWLADPTAYAGPTYVGMVLGLLGTLGIGRVAWVGTSMGGIVGMLLAALPETPIERLVVNDVGPFIPKAALAAIGTYVGLDPRFGDRAEAEAYLRRVHAEFGPLPDAWWGHLARHGVRPDPAGGYRLHYDPAIRIPFAQGIDKDLDLWAAWDAIRCPTLMLRGAVSGLLPAETAAEAALRGPGACSGSRPEVRIVTFAGVGHAPALVAADQIAVVRDFVLGSASQPKAYAAMSSGPS